ncbi:MAG: hypothetical protein WAP11_08700 [Acetomicrobium sp.]
MSMVECYLCGKGFVTTGPKVCPTCMKRLDKLYFEARDYIRDNPRLRLNVRELADALSADPRDVQTLVDLGRLELEGECSEEHESISEKEKLLREFEKHLKESGGKRSSRVKYAAEKYGKETKEDQ